MQRKGLTMSRSTPRKLRKFLSELLFKNEVISLRRVTFEQQLCCFHARSYLEAVRKTLSFGADVEKAFPSLAFPDEKVTFCGVVSLSEVYEGLDDGAELTFTEFDRRSERRLRSRLWKQQDLMEIAKSRDQQRAGRA
jgi:hypothetical protein